MTTKMGSPSQRRHLEIEVKLKVRNLKKLRQKIVALGFEETTNRSFEDNWILDYPNRSLTAGRCLLRLRQFNGKVWLTFKGPAIRSTHFKIREELETEIGDKAIFHSILERLGLVLVFRYQKYRSAFERRSRIRKVVLTLDETPIGNYLEIEGTGEDIKTIASQLGYSRQDYITESYLSLYVKSKARSRNWEMIFSK